MSRTIELPVLIEWTSSWVRALNPATGDAVDGATIEDVAQKLRGPKDAVVGVGHSHVFLKSLRLPKAAPDDLRNIIGIQLGTLFPLDATQLSFDFIQTEDHNADGWLTVVAAIRSDDLRRIRMEVRQAGLNLLRILPLALAAGGVASRSGNPDALIVEKGRTGLSLDVVQAGLLTFSRLAPPSSDPATEARRTLAAAQTGVLPTVALGAIDIPGSISSSGSLLSALNEAPAFNFELMEDRVKAAKQHMSGRMRMAALMVTAALLLVLLVWADRQDAQAVVTRSEGTWSGQLTRLNSTANFETDRLGQIQTVATTLHRAFAPAQPLSDVTAVISDSLPPGAWLTGLDVERGKPIEARGTAKSESDVTQFVTALAGNSRFRAVQLVFANPATVGNTSVVEFNVTAIAVGNLPMPVPQTKKRTSSTSTSIPTVDTGQGGLQ